MIGPLLHPDAAGLYCEPGRFHVDPWLPVDVACITHAHADHARAGSKLYYCSKSTEPLLRIRLGPFANLRGIPYGDQFTIGETTLSFHPAGHVLGSAQLRVQRGSCSTTEVWVASGDYKRTPDPTCAPFEVIPSDVFITESTFALPIYRWPDPRALGDDMLSWWDSCSASGKAALLLGYSLGKVQRAVAEIAASARRHNRPLGRIFMHGACAALTDAYRLAGIDLPPIEPLPDGIRPSLLEGSLTIAPPLAIGTPWAKRFGGADRHELAFASGFMGIRGVRRRGGYDRGFPLSDHADWPSLLATIRQTGAPRILVTHGNIDTFVRYLRDTGINAEPLRTLHGTQEED